MLPVTCVLIANGTTNPSIKESDEGLAPIETINQPLVWFHGFLL